jgi:hypothetical protein
MEWFLRHHLGFISSVGQWGWSGFWDIILDPYHPSANEDGVVFETSFWIHIICRPMRMEWFLRHHFGSISSVGQWGWSGFWDIILDPYHPSANEDGVVFETSFWIRIICRPMRMERLLRHHFGSISSVGQWGWSDFWDLILDPYHPSANEDGVTFEGSFWIHIIY